MVTLAPGRREQAMAPTRDSRGIDQSSSQSRPRRVVAIVKVDVHRAETPDERKGTHSAVSPRAADGCIAGMMRGPIRARLTSDAALLLW